MAIGSWSSAAGKGLRPPPGGGSASAPTPPFPSPRPPPTRPGAGRGVAVPEPRRVAAGFFSPFRQELFLDGKLLEVASVRSVEVNTGLSDSLFDPDALLKGTSR